MSNQLQTDAILFWRVRAVLGGGPTPWSGAKTFATHPTAVTVEGVDPVPSELGLTIIYPNPSNGQARVRFSLREASPVSIHVYDVPGRRVGVVLDASLPAVVHEVSFHQPGLPSGLYLVRMQSGGFADAYADDGPLIYRWNRYCTLKNTCRDASRVPYGAS